MPLALRLEYSVTMLTCGFFTFPKQDFQNLSMEKITPLNHSDTSLPTKRYFPLTHHLFVLLSEKLGIYGLQSLCIANPYLEDFPVKGVTSCL